MASLQESFKAALENAQMAASLLSIEQDRAERDAARDWPHLRDCLVHTFSNASPIPLSEGDRPGDILGAANAIATLQARLKEEELLEALGWLRKLSIVAMKLKDDGQTSLFGGGQGQGRASSFRTRRDSNPRLGRRSLDRREAHHSCRREACCCTTPFSSRSSRFQRKPSKPPFACSSSLRVRCLLHLFYPRANTCPSTSSQ
ncbi:hypothetical protein BCR35DRAFT_193476 [Leucosporidium creatinivorum]|uniref:Uncharacterized protein n=1 Tax=Leucosporidium creatinivorum TaxID=106004 RepID=A0A1Y2G2N7_9BASI|nr:hypothetical protein BCR35DRAFT_193476 [Leucosporidium creatinivorum]